MLDLWHWFWKEELPGQPGPQCMIPIFYFILCGVALAILIGNAYYIRQARNAKEEQMHINYIRGSLAFIFFGWLLPLVAVCYGLYLAVRGIMYAMPRRQR